MPRPTVMGLILLLTSTSLIVPLPVAWAQQANSIAGAVRDTTGAVLPGVTVEATSPALIEKVRTVVTDQQGQYQIVDLRPGTYAVTFSLTGFNTVRREGVELTAGFSATINAEMRVGAIEETVTVTGRSPLVDVENARRQSVVSNEVVRELPTGTIATSSIAALTPGLTTTTAANVGGAAGTFSSASVSSASFHGKPFGNKVLYDGLGINTLAGPGATGFILSPASVEEWIVETGGGLAESNAATGVVLNVIPKEGGNVFSGSFSGLYTNDHLESNNLTDALRARGLTTVNKILFLYEGDASVGGPVKRDKLWFFTSQRWIGNKNQNAGVFYNKTQGTPFYTPDFDRPAFRIDHLHSHSARLTWQASQKNKVNVYGEIQRHCVCRGRAEFEAPEVAYIWDFHNALAQVTWSSPLTSRVLLQAAAGAAIAHNPSPLQAEVKPTDIGILEQSTGFVYNARATYNIPSGGQTAYGKPRNSDRYIQRFAVSYVTGSHAVKAGFNMEEGNFNQEPFLNGAVTYRFLNGVPNQVTQYAMPVHILDILNPDLGIFVQDAWKVKRLTLNLGLRFDYLNAHAPAVSLPAGPWVPERNFGAVDNIPDTKDLSPRLGASYDLFGDGRTALKVSLGKFLYPTDLQVAYVATPVQSASLIANRTWNDANKNYVPDCDLRSAAANGECGALDDQGFGQLNIKTRYADDVVRGFGNRDYLWDFATELQRELRPDVSVTAGYYRNWYGNFRVTDNLAVTPADYSPFCITAPVDSRLPNGGGYQVCGLADVSPAKFGRVDNLVSQAAQFGKQTRVSDFVAVNLKTRFGSGIQLGGGVDTGRTVTDSCFVTDSPQELLYCHVVTPFSAQTQVKLYGSYPLPLPGDFVVSAVYQDTSGPSFGANYAATNAQIRPSLGRNLAACGTSPVCTATATVPLVAPQTLFESRRRQLDLRLSKRVRLSPKLRLNVSVDAYNALNASPVLILNSTYGPTWQRPTGAAGSNAILDGRVVEFSARLSF